MDPQVQIAVIGVIASVVTSVFGQIAGYLLILRWIIRRQVDGAWVLRVDHDQQMADKEALVVAEREVSREWKDAWTAELAAGRVKDDTINKSVAANKVSDHFYETVMPKLTRSGDNGVREGASP